MPATSKAEDGLRRKVDRDGADGLVDARAPPPLPCRGIGSARLAITRRSTGREVETVPRCKARYASAWGDAKRICVGIDVATDVHRPRGLERAEGARGAGRRSRRPRRRGLGPPRRHRLDRLLTGGVLIGAGLVLVHVPDIAVDCAARGHAGDERKSDPRDARVIADLVRTRAAPRAETAPPGPPSAPAA